MKDKTITVAILDDGVDFDKLSITGSEFVIVPYEYESSSKNGISHGTVCTYIIKECIKNAKVSFVSVRVLGNSGRGAVNDFLLALDWCITNDVDIINCSLGSVENADFDKIRLAITQVVKANIIVIAAQNNCCKYTVPACLPNVIGVKFNYRYINGNYLFKWYPLDDIEVETSAVNLIMTSGLSFNKYLKANSFAAPVVTAQVADIIHEHGKCDYYDVLKHLSHNAKKVIGKYHSNSSPYIWNQGEENLSCNDEWNMIQYSKCFQTWINPCAENIDVPILRIWGRDKYVKIFIDVLIELLKNNGSTYLFIAHDKTIKGKNKPIVVPLYGDFRSVLSCLYKKFLPDLLIVYSDYEGQYDVEIHLDETSTISCIESKDVFSSDSMDHDKISELIGKLFDILY